MIQYPDISSIERLCTELEQSETAGSLQTIRSLLRYMKGRIHILEVPDPEHDIRRWKGRVMIHPDMLALHQSRVGIFAELLGDFLGLKGFKRDYVVILGTHHDSPELISPFGDIITPKKHSLSKQNYDTLVQIESIVERRTEKSIGLAKGFYEEYRSMSAIEHHLVKLADILDAFFVAAMEVRSGNKEFECKIQGASQGRFHQLANSEILHKINFQEQAKELIKFAGDIHTSTPPALYRLWQQVHKKVQDDIARRIWTGELDEYPNTIMSPFIP